MNKDYLVSVYLITFNHEKYITKAIESVLSQKVSFTIELIIGDDYSTDKTREIISEYAQKHPHIIKQLLPEKHLGMAKTIINTFIACSGKYIAILEGDDYWTDPFKLQKQVEFLEKNKEFGLSYSDIETINTTGKKVETNFVKMQRTNYKSGTVFFDLLQKNFINTLTVVARKIALMQVLQEINEDNINFVFDYFFWLSICIDWKVHYLDEVTAHYRVHEAGISNNKERLKMYSLNAKHYSLNKYLSENKIYTNEQRNTLVKISYLLIRSRKYINSDKKQLLLFLIKNFNILFIQLIKKLIYRYT